MFSFIQNKNSTISDDNFDDVSIDTNPVKGYKSYASKEILENEIFNTKNSYEDIPTDIDISFAQNFNSKGGKFVYCSNVQELFEKIESFLINNKISSAFIWEDEIYSPLKQKFQNSIHIERTLDEAKCAISLCESLVADEGSIIINPNQNRFRPLEGFPKLHIIVAFKSQLKVNIEHSVSDFLKKYVDFFPFIIDLSKEEKPTRFASNKPVLNSRGTKQIIVFYCEDSIFEM